MLYETIPVYGIIGFGPVGRATRARISRRDQSVLVRDHRGHAYVCDRNISIQDGINAGLPLLNDANKMDTVFVCISLTSTSFPSVTPAAAAQQICDAITQSWFFSYCTPNTKFVVRSTVPVGTMDNLHALMPSLKFFVLPEFATEADMDGTSSVKCRVLGVPADKAFFYRMNPSHLGIISMLLPGRHILPYKHAEFIKIACNVIRASQVHLGNVIVQGAERVGLEPLTVEQWLTEEDVLDIEYTSWMFGGKCLDKDLRMWSDMARDSFGTDLIESNESAISRSCEALRKARYYSHDAIRDPVEDLHVTLIGLENAPASGSTLNGPAQKWVESQDLTSKWMVSAPKKLEEQFYTAGSLGRHRGVTPESVNCIIIAQRLDSWRIDQARVKKVLRESEQPVKFILNACNGYMTDAFVEDCFKLGGVFVDKQELDYLHQQSTIDEALWN